MVAFSKGVIPYHILDIMPDGIFLPKMNFSANLKIKQSAIQKMRMQNNFSKCSKSETLNNTNDLHNVQDIILLCEIFENSASYASNV